MERIVIPALVFQCAQFPAFTLRVNTVSFTFLRVPPNSPSIMQERKLLTDITDNA